MRSAVLVAAILLFTFAFLGKAILFALNIELASFKVAGGILLMFIALDILGGGASERKLRATAGVGAVPMGTPLLAGPGAITTVMTILQSFSDIVVLLAIAASIFATWLVLSLFVFCSFGNVLGPFCFFLTITCSHSHSRSQPLTHSLTVTYIHAYRHLHSRLQSLTSSLTDTDISLTGGGPLNGSEPDGRPDAYSFRLRGGCTRTLKVRRLRTFSPGRIGGLALRSA